VKKFTLFLLLTLFSVSLFAETDANDELLKAYKREFAFLKEQKESLKRQLKKTKNSNNSSLRSAKRDIDKLQRTILGFNSMIETEREKLSKAQMNQQSASDDNSMVESVMMQMKSSLKEQGIELEDNKNYSKVLKSGFEVTVPLVEKLQSITKEQGSFYLQDGSEIKGEIIKVGNIASFGISEKNSGALAPAGDNNLKLWKSEIPSDATAKALANGEHPDKLNIFIYESLEKEVADRKEKTAMEVIDSGGIIGWAIIWLGVFAMFLALIRALLLMVSNSNTKNLISAVMPSIEKHDLESAKEALEGFNGSTVRVIKATLRNIHRDRDFVEDIIAENILNESSKIDRFGSVILVIAAVAPLLGLLGTVTGMIATFDIITEFGTGDPKLLAGGISVALVTTELGLIVAIPALLIGNLLSGWANSIKDSMEQQALHIVNQYHKSVDNLNNNTTAQTDININKN
jgi:biopolymer transport protein ExbB